jgi:large subunit ribosomal protein L34e
MPAGKHKSNSLRKVFKTTPGGRNTVHYVRRKPSKAQCGGCGKALSGVPKENKAKMNNMPKTQKRPERPFGGVLCSSCSKRVIIEESREE